MKQDGGKLRVERPQGKGKETEFYVTGSGVVSVPVARANEIQRVIMELHRLEAARALGVVCLNRVV